MPAPYSKDLRAKAIAAYKSGRGNQRAVAELFGIGEASLRRGLALERDTGTLAAHPAPALAAEPSMLKASSS